MRARLLLVLLSLLAGLLGATPAAAQEAPPPPPAPALYGAVDATDGRAVNALIGFDFLDAQGRRIRRDGCLQSPECPLVGYASVLRINPTLPAEGSADRTGLQVDWSMQVPTATAQVFIEVYPQNASLRTDEARYGHVMRHSVKLPLTGPVDLRLPLVLCGEGGTVGSIAGTAVSDGQPKPLRRVVAWSLDAYDPVVRPVLGWNIGTARPDGTWVLPNLPPDQRYQVWLTAEDGQVRKSFGVPVSTCAETALTVDFTPPATATVALSAPTLDRGSAEITVGSSATMTGAAEPGQVVELWGYSRPSTALRLLRTATAMPSGLYTFGVTPPTDTRLEVRAGGKRSPSVVVGVRTAPRLAVLRTGTRAYRFSGTVLPRRAGVRVDVLARTTSGLRLLTSARTAADGRWSVDRRFTGTAAWDVLARTAADGTNRPGLSNVVPTRIR